MFEWEAAAGRDRPETEPHATAARYDKRLRMVRVTLHTGLTVAFHPTDVQYLETATVADLSVIELDTDGFGPHFPAIDADVWLPSLLAGQFGSKNWMAMKLGAAGGKVRSPAKAAASRANGKLGGRPRKQVA